MPKARRQMPECSMQTISPFTSEISHHIWETKYRYCEDGRVCDETVMDSWRRISNALAAVEPKDQAHWEQRFYDALAGFKFLPGGRIQAGAGTNRNVTLFNCFVMGTIEDSMEGIFGALYEGAITMQHGGGVGYDFSTLRPRGTHAKGVGAIASGPISFMQVWDAMCETILSTGARRGAMMATLRCDHPDIVEFVDAKQRPGMLRHFNLSIQVNDDFMTAVRADNEWLLVFPVFPPAGHEAGEDTVLRKWPGFDEPVHCHIHHRLRARDLWEGILRATYDYAEPGVLFIDRINQFNNLWYREHISATNPCGEVPLPPYGACDLGSINLTRFVGDPFAPDATFDEAALRSTAEVATRLLDNVIDASRFPLPQQAKEACGARRIGLGITGLADTLIMLGMKYGSDESLAFAAEVMRQICHASYRTSVQLAKEKGPFPYFDRKNYGQGEFIRGLPEDIQEGIAKHGIRNSHLIAIAPTGTISLLASNVSSGLEPVYAAAYKRCVLNKDGSLSDFEMVDHAVEQWRDIFGCEDGLPAAFVSAEELGPRAHLDMQAALQPYVDNSISKTINVPEDYPFEAFKEVYDLAYDKGLKGCTTFRPNPTTGSILTTAAQSQNAPHCCAIEREPD